MANPEHLAILKQGVDVWNQWREQHRDDIRHWRGSKDYIGDLSGADLSGARIDGVKLGGADLAGANLFHASLDKADLDDADLERANLTEANLYRARFDFAKLGAADLSGAYAKEANFCHASLIEANARVTNFCKANLRDTELLGTMFGAANLAGSDLSGAYTRQTRFDNVDLSDVNGLDSVNHLGPSTIGVDTIYNSRGMVPDAFLRGCGLRDWEIEAARLYHPDLSTAQVTELLYRVIHLRGSQPFLYYSCFISYSAMDEQFADQLYADLQAKGVRCWFAPHDIKGGRKIHEQIDEAIRLHDKLLLILSEHSMKSDWVQTEIAKARKREAQEKRQMLFPVSLVPYDPVVRDWECFDADRGKDSGREIREYFIPDFSNWKDHNSYQAAFQRLVKDLKS